jgi:nitrate/nitrite transport system ATP-binding protein
MAYLELSGVSKSYGSGASRTPVLDRISLAMDKGEFVAIVGYSGSGKTTLMSLIAGLIEPDSGGIIFNGREVNGPSPDRGLVFQNYSLLPWLTVEGNVRLAVDRLYGSESACRRRERVRDAVSMVNLTPALAKRPRELSGGMRQRTSVARTLAMNPSLLLLDEPLSALDALTRAVIQDQILDIWRAQHQTIILITNDVDEALYMADRIIPLTMGPGATFGPETKVELPRPRDRKALNHDPVYKRLRHDIIAFLLNERRQRGSGSSQNSVKPSPPSVRPRDITSRGFGWFTRKAPAPTSSHEAVL